MADNYLEKKMEELQARKAKEARARQVAWKKRMDAYRKRLEEEAAAGADQTLASDSCNGSGVVSGTALDPVPGNGDNIRND